MNAPLPIHRQLAAPNPALQADNDEIDLIEYWDIIVDHRWLVAAVTAIAIAVGSAYSLLARPVYEANLLIQVEDSASSAKSFLGEAASLFDVKTPAAAEIEILRSRMVIGRAVDSTSLYISAAPRYLPIVGGWLARRAKDLSDPGFLGFGGFVTGTEKIAVSAFDVPERLEGTGFRLTAQGDGRYLLSHSDLTGDLGGTVGVPLIKSTPLGTVTLLVSGMEGRPGAEFNLARQSRLATVAGLQSSLRLSERGRQSGVIDATLQGGN
ncbi:Wzz/FepE/Etk N-terminal domain-containing protein, partial [Ramlibacter sp.]|uniref:Wzz/FepE/Etk N-terminal domain-containing protein n=1 Tax=Ramlibacter sp. TaxID=1917967 RepID=UPI002BFE8F8E